MKFTKKRIIILIIIILVLMPLIYKFFLAPEKQNYNFELAKIGDITQEVSAVGQVKKGEEINLGFKHSGKIDEIYVKVGENVEEKEELIKLDTSQALIQLSDAKASFDLARAECNSAQINYLGAKQNLENVKKLAEENLKSGYSDAMNAMEDSYLKVYNAFNAINYIHKTYFNIGIGDEESSLVKEARNKAEVFKDQTKSYLGSAKKDSGNENIDFYLSKTKDALSGIYGNLKQIREACESGNYRNVVSSADKTSLDNQKGYINGGLASLSNAIQKIAITKINNKSSIDSAQASFESAQGNIRFGDIDLCEAKIKKAEANVNLLENQISDSTIKSPAKGQITKVIKKTGEQALAGETMISLLSEKQLQVETDIAETDSVKIDLGNSVKIILDAFPGEEFLGKVIEIDPAETVVSGVIYYKTKISLDSENQKIKPGMTANINILTGSKEKVLLVPRRSVSTKNGKSFVKILGANEAIEEKEVQLGLAGSAGEIEILSGLEEGDKVITLIKSK